MQWKDLGWLTAIGWLLALVAGCSHERIVQISEVATPPSFPTALRGQTVIVRLAFPKSDQQIEPGQFKPDTICYLTAGDIRIDCQTDGSTLVFGPNDSADLLTDNPMAGIEPAHDDPSASQSMKLYGVLFLVAGSLDRLPGALADYIQDPGPNLAEAVELAEMLLNEKQVELAGCARGGNFVASIELTDDGRDKLIDALDQVGESGSTIQRVKASGVME
jgi:hypothetical protein